MTVKDTAAACIKSIGGIDNKIFKFIINSKNLYGNIKTFRYFL